MIYTQPYLFVSEKRMILLEGNIEPRTLKVVNNLRISQLLGQSIIMLKDYLLEISVMNHSVQVFLSAESVE